MPRFARESFGPGDTVEGVLVVSKPIERVERLDAHLRYLDRSPDFSGGVTFDSAEPLFEGPLALGQEVPFRFALPADALPNWQDPTTANMGSLSWAIVIETIVDRGLDTTTTHSVPVNQAATWRGPDGVADAEGEVKASGMKRWDVTIAPDRWSLRRGERLNVAVEIGDPDAGRDKLELGLMCQADYAVEYVTRDSDGSRSTRRETRRATLFEDWPELDPGAASQTVTFRVPPDAPFSYDGSAFGFRWFVLAREAVRLRSDPHRSARLLVLP